MTTGKSACDQQSHSCRATTVRGALLNHLSPEAYTLPSECVCASATAQVWELPWSSIQRLRWPGGERVPLLADVLGDVAQRFRHITLDLKPKEQA